MVATACLPPGARGEPESLDRLGRLSVTCVDRVQPDSLHTGERVRVFLKFVSVSCTFFETVELDVLVLDVCASC